MLRIATPDDLDAVCALLEVMDAEQALGRVNDQKARAAVSEIVNNNSCLVTEWRGGIVGSLGLYMSDTWRSDDRILSARWFYVHPEHRADKNENGHNAGHATKLIAWAKAAADIKRMPLVIGADAPGGQTHVFRLLRKHMTPLNGAFVHYPKVAA